MKIDKLELRRFGKFQDKTLQLHEGLNVLYTSNESGKSTLAAFIRYMLYGFPKNERTSTANPVTVAGHYKPWQGGEVSGSLSMTVKDRKVTVVREGARDFRVFDALSGEEIRLTQEPGEDIFGLSLDTFESTAFFGQSMLQNVKISDLEDKLKNMLTGADEDVSYEKAKDLLNKAKNKIDSGRGGEIPKLRQEISELSYRIEQVRGEQASLGDISDEGAQLAQKLQIVKDKHAEWEARLAELKEEAKQGVSGKQVALKKERNECMAQIEEVKARLGGKTRAQVDDLNNQAQRLQALKDVMEEVVRPIPPRNMTWLLWTSIGVFVMGLLFAFISLWGATLAAALIGSAGLVWYFVGSTKGKMAYERQSVIFTKEQQRHMQALALQGVLITKLGIKDNFMPAIQALYQDLATLSDLQIKEEQIKAKLSEATAEADPADNEEYQALMERCRQATVAEQQLQVKIAESKTMHEERARYVGSVDVLLSELNEKQQRVEVLERRLTSYRLALDALDRAHRQMTDLFAPVLAERTAKFFSAVTSDESRRVTVDVAGKVRIEEKGEPRHLQYFSVGTGDAVYISLRLALIDMLYTTEKPVLVFDDSFSNFDEKRLRDVLGLLATLSQRVQILYFTCRDPYAQLVDLPYNTIEL